MKKLIFLLIALASLLLPLQEANSTIYFQQDFEASSCDGSAPTGWTPAAGPGYKSTIVRCSPLTAPSGSKYLEFLSMPSTLAFTDTWQASHAYSVGTYILPTSGHETGYFYIATTGGTSGSSEPSWPVADGTWRGSSNDFSPCDPDNHGGECTTVVGNPYPDEVTDGSVVWQVRNHQAYGIDPTMTTVTGIEGNTYWFAWYQRWGTVYGKKIYVIADQDADKNVEVLGNEFRWVFASGLWGWGESPSMVSQSQFTSWEGQAAIGCAYHCNDGTHSPCPNDGAGDAFAPTSPYSTTSPYRLEYNKWYAFVIKIKVSSDSMVADGEVTQYINGTRVSYHPSICTHCCGGTPTFTTIGFGGTLNQGMYEGNINYKQLDGFILTNVESDVSAHMADPEAEGETAPAAVRNLSITGGGGLK